MNSKSGTVSPDNSDCSERDKFSVSFTHRLHFTEDIFGRQRGILVNLIERSGDHKTRVQVWLDSYVAEAQPNLRTQLEALFDELRATVTLCGIHVCIGGEEVKNSWCHVEGILSAINDANLDRRSYVLVIGGGAVLDAVGFAAATAHRGIRLIRLPTTTLAQADSGVGVKNAVNRFGKKNWLGTFAVPWAVINDSSLIDTLPDRQFRAGFSEAVKVALLKSKSGFEALEKNAQSVRERESQLPGSRQ